MTTALAVPERVMLLREVSEGPLAALFAAERRRGDEVRLVAVKVLRHRRARDREQLARMRETGRRLDRLAHRNIVAATEVALVDGRPALLAPWVDGVDLLDWVEVLRETEQRLPGRVICEILRGGAAALDAAHNRIPYGAGEALGAVHRDVKPTNLMVSRDGDVKLLDFGTGFTSLAGRDARAGAAKAGLSRYLAPGRRQGKRGGPASDVYALGLVGVELFRGRWLQKVKDQNPAHDRHLAEIVASLPDTGMKSPQDDRALRSLLLRMVAFDPEARPPATEIAQTLRTLADRASGPSLESFAHDHAHWGEQPDPVPGLPDVTVVEPDQLPIEDGAEPSGEIPIQLVRSGVLDEPTEDHPVLPSAVDTAPVSLEARPPAPAPNVVLETTPVSQPRNVERPRTAGALAVVGGAAVGGIAIAAAVGVVIGLAIGLLF